MSNVPLNLSNMSYRDNLAATDATSGANPVTGSGKLWLPIWSGEVLHAYDEYKSFEPMVTSKMIDSGREMEFPLTGTVSLKPQWGAGEYLVGGDDSASTTFSVTLDARPMAAHFELDNVDLMITQWEYRQELARQAGQTLANARDKQIGAFLALAGAVGPLQNDDDPAATSDPRGVNFPVPYQLTGYTNTDTVVAAEDALDVLQAIEDYIVDLQENNVPVGPTYCAVTPRVFQAIRRLGVADSNNVTNTQPMFGGVAAAGGLGAPFTQGMSALSDSLVYMGVTIVKSNHLPNQNYTGASIGEARYNVNGSPEAAGVGADIVGLMWQPDAVASIRKTGLVVDTEDDVRRNTTFTVASMMSGTGILKPELAKVIVGSSVTAAVSGKPTRAEILTCLEVTAAQAGYVQS